MSYIMRHPLEEEVLRLAPQQDLQLCIHQAQALLRSGGYAVATGLYLGRHYRKKVGTGCYHLRIFDGRATLHWDRWDPRRHPLEHFFETPALWGAGLALGALAVFGVAAANSER